MWLWSSRSRVSLFWKPRCTYLDEKEVSRHALHAVNKEVSVSPWYRWASECVRETKIYDTGRPLIILKNPYRTLQACFLVTCLKTPEENQSIKEDRVAPMAIKVVEQVSFDVSGRRRLKKLLTVHLVRQVGDEAWDHGRTKDVSSWTAFCHRHPGRTTICAVNCALFFFSVILGFVDNLCYP